MASSFLPSSMLPYVEWDTGDLKSEITRLRSQIDDYQTNLDAIADKAADTLASVATAALSECTGISFTLLNPDDALGIHPYSIAKKVSKVAMKAYFENEISRNQKKISDIKEIIQKREGCSPM